MAKKLTFRELAEFIAHDITIDIFPDIVWPPETRLAKDKINWLTERLETLHTRYLNCQTEPEEETLVQPLDPDDEDLV
jgi:hypothetical protein